MEFKLLKMCAANDWRELKITVLRKLILQYAQIASLLISGSIWEEFSNYNTVFCLQRSILNSVPL